jgi:hypothetical protein
MEHQAGRKSPITRGGYNARCEKLISNLHLATWANCSTPYFTFNRCFGVQVSGASHFSSSPCSPINMRKTVLSTRLFLSTAHTPVIGTGYPTGQSGVRSFGPLGAKLDANIAVGLCPNIDSNILGASAARDYPVHSVFRSYSDTLILRRANSRTPGAIECAGRRHIYGNRLRDNAA